MSSIISIRADINGSDNMTSLTLTALTTTKINGRSNTLLINKKEKHKNNNIWASRTRTKKVTQTKINFELV